MKKESVGLAHDFRFWFRFDSQFKIDSSTLPVVLIMIQIFDLQSVAMNMMEDLARRPCASTYGLIAASFIILLDDIQKPEAYMVSGEKTHMRTHAHS